MKAKAKAAAAKAKPGEGCLPSPGTAAWKDVSYQLQQMEKKGDTRLKKSFNACQSQQAKRKWYYNIFLLDPAISKKEVHKISLEKASFEITTSRGWITKWKVGELEGANLGKGGGSSSHALPAEPTEEELEAEAYKKALGSLKKAINALSSSLDKGAVLKETLASLPNAGDAVVKAHIECLEKAAKSYGDSKADWLKTLGTYPSKIKPGEGNLVEKLERKKGNAKAISRS